jgi:hypothetical protein
MVWILVPVTADTNSTQTMSLALVSYVLSYRNDPQGLKIALISGGKVPENAFISRQVSYLELFPEPDKLLVFQ